MCSVNAIRVAVKELPSIFVSKILFLKTTRRGKVSATVLIEQTSHFILDKATYRSVCDARLSCHVKPLMRRHRAQISNDRLEDR